MPTQYEILLQQQLQQPHPLDAYSTGLVDLARFQAQQRFVQQRAAEEQAAALEIERSREAASREIERSREGAALEREKLGQAGAAARSTEEAQTRLKVAEIAERARGKVQDAQEQARLIRKFEEKNIVREKGETDEDYIARAQKESITQAAGHLYSAYTMARDYSREAAEITAKANETYPQRLSQYAWDQVKLQIDPKRRKALEAIKDPNQRDLELAKLMDPDKSDGKTLLLTYQMALSKAQQGAVTQFTPEQQTKLKELEADQKVAEANFSLLHRDERYASAIPEFNRLIGRQPSEIGGETVPWRPPMLQGPGRGGAGGGAARDFSRMMTPSVTGTVKADAPAGAAVGAPAATTGPPTPAEAMPLGMAIKEQGLLPYVFGSARDALFRKPAPMDLAGAMHRTARFLYGPDADAALIGLQLPSTLPDRAVIGGGDFAPPDTVSFAARPPIAAGPAEIAAAPVPQTLNRLNQEQQLLDAYVRGRAPMFDPTAVRGRAPEILPAAPVPVPVPAMAEPSPAVAAPEVMGARALRTARVKQALRLKYPRSVELLNLERIPLEDLENIYNGLERERNTGGAAALPSPVWPPRSGPVIDVPSEVLR